LQRVEVEEKERAGGPLVDRQYEAPVLDPVAGVGPLVRILEREVHAVGADALAIDEQLRELAVADDDVVAELDPMADGLAPRQRPGDERPITAMQVGVREVADIVDNDRVMGAPGEIDRYASPARGSLELGDFRHRRAVRPRRVAGEQPDQSIARADRIRPDPDVAELPAEQVMRDVGELAVLVVAP